MKIQLCTNNRDTDTTGTLGKAKCTPVVDWKPMFRPPALIHCYYLVPIIVDRLYFSVLLYVQPPSEHLFIFLPKSACAPKK